MTTAFVLSGGGSLGAVQVGMLQALSAHGIRPDFLIGTSAGALNATWVAVHGTSGKSLADLAEVWEGLRRRDVFPLEVSSLLRALLGRSPALCSADNLGDLVRKHAGVELLEQAATPVHLVTADVLSGETVMVSSGSVVSGVLASAAIPGIFPPVLRRGRHLVDGGVAEHTGVAQAAELGASLIYVLPTGSPCALPRPPSSPISAAVHALTLLIEQRLVHEVADVSAQVTVKVLPPLCPLRISAADFGHAAELIDRARKASDEWIDSGDVDLPEPHRFLELHRHATERRDSPFGVGA